MTAAPPRTERELLETTARIARRSLGELAREAGLPPPPPPRHAKGWAGQLMEALLGASAASLSEPDFQLIGVELKTVPVNPAGRPRESTYVCTVPLLNSGGLRWEESCVFRKLSRVLWVPIETAPGVPLAERTVGEPVLWSPDVAQARALHLDWEELMEAVCLGGLESITARDGTVLQIRPKAADSRERRGAIGATGAPVRTQPRGFYLRASFTGRILSAEGG